MTNEHGGFSQEALDSLNEIFGVDTIPTGNYRVKGNPFEWEANTHEKARFPGRVEGRVAFDVFDLQSDRKLGRVFASVTYEETWVEVNGKRFLDDATKIFLQAAKVFGTLKNHEETREALGKYSLNGYIKEIKGKSYLKSVKELA